MDSQALSILPLLRPSVIDANNTVFGMWMLTYPQQNNGGVHCKKRETCPSFYLCDTENMEKHSFLAARYKTHAKTSNKHDGAL